MGQTQLKEEIRRGFAGLRDPLAGLLDMLEGSGDWKKKGHSLGYYITTELQLWIKEHPAAQQSDIKLKKLQARVLSILAQCPAKLLDPLISIYQLHTADRNYLLGHVSHLYHKGDYKEVGHVFQTHLPSQLPSSLLMSMCTPLLLQDKANLVEDYVEEYPELQSKLLHILDTWCEPRFNIKDITSTVGENQWLQRHLIQLLTSYCDLNTAARWAQRCNLPKEMLPCRVADELQKLHIQERYILCFMPFPYRLLIIQGLHICLKLLSVLQPEQVVGIDMESRPSFGMVGKPRVSLLQIALKDEVFLLDLPRLFQQAEVDGEKEKLPHFIQMLYSDASITKLGYGMSGDLSNLAATWSALKDTDKKAQGVVDLLTVDKRQSDEGRGVKQPEKGLSLLVQYVLGKPLDKTEQLSNWEKRPLREEQILYAASDAYCLLEIYEKLCKDPESFGLNSDLTENLVGKESIKPKAQKQLNKQEALTDVLRHLAPISPKEFSVVCDNMLQGLGRYLRCLGVDVQMLENGDDHRKAAEIARQEGRVILTSGLPYQTLQSQVAEGRCFSVNSSEKPKEQALQVLKYFNVQVSLSDIFSRCQMCNCNKYLKVSREKMRQLVEDSMQEKPHQRCDAAVSSHGTAQPCCSVHTKRLEGPVLAGGTVLQVAAIPPGVLDKDKLTHFYCCTGCGKVFWEGSHFGRLVSQFQDAVSSCPMPCSLGAEPSPSWLHPPVRHL
uniref:Uncharacterized protein n=1 Tax=Melopsittacus undulatus TaxID=13146 RepID=A0A8C6K3F2_MELUD